MRRRAECRNSQEIGEEYTPCGVDAPGVSVDEADAEGTDPACNHKKKSSVSAFQSLIKSARKEETE